MQIARPGVLAGIFDRIVADGWAPRQPACGSELVGLERSLVRGTCIAPLVMEGDVLLVDRSAPPMSEDIVSFRLSARAVAAQNSALPPGQQPWAVGALWAKLFVIYRGIPMLFDRYGGSISASFATCESPDGKPILHPVRNVWRAGRLLFTPGGSPQCCCLNYRADGC